MATARQCSKIETRSRNHCCSGKAITIKYCEYASVALVIQHAKRTRHIVLSLCGLNGFQYFTKSSHKRYDFREKGNFFNIKCFDFPHNFFLKYFFYEKFCEISS